MKQLLGNHQQQIITHGYPDLCVDCVARCPIERFDMQSPLQEFEERLHIPAFAVKFRNGKSRETEVIGNECVNVVRGIVLIDNHAYPFRIICGCPQSCEHDFPVADDASAHVHRAFGNHLVLHVALCPGDKQGMLLVEQIIEPLEVNIALVHEVVRKGFYRQLVHDLAVMDLAFSEVNKGRYAASETEQRMHLESALSVMELRPWAKLEAEFDSAAVECVNHAVYIQAVIVFVIQLSRFLDKILCQVVVDAPVLCLIQVGKRGTRDKGESGMVQFALESRKGRFIGAKTLLRSELGEAHHHKLVATAELDLMSIAVVSCDALAEDVLWKQRHDLGEYALTLIHLICSLHCYQMQSYKIKSSKNFIAVNH